MTAPQVAKERFGHGLEVFLKNEYLAEAPHCPHGPMLLFERFFKDGRSSCRFFACSAARDRKGCAFFQWEGEKISETRKNAHRQIVQDFREPYRQACDGYNKLFGNLDDKRRQNWLFCHSCDTLLVLKEKKNHLAHDCEESGDLSKPTMILRPRENEKTQAQYFFSRKATEFLVDLVKGLGFKNVICVGTPRLHEEIQCRQSPSDLLDSLLLDIDYRYAQFFPPSKFCWYNMFNHFFFGSHVNEETFQTFLRKEGLLMVMDPPFGGLAEVLADSIKTIWNIWRKAFSFESDKELPTMWIFPYFMEPHIKAALPSMTMLDYKVDYDNHPHFKSKKMKGSKRGSPVRIFTNINPTDVVLPSSEGYRFCGKCKRYVAPENIHCVKCNSCMSKNGRQYIHCEMCGTCVKPGLQHCITCGRCELVGHSCERPLEAGTCHICGELGHKRRKCPMRSSEPPRKRRKQENPGEAAKTIFHKKKPFKEPPRKTIQKKKIK
ncbi:rRNA N6-adenosine-methyltransferase ZCCHC4-like isoform X2 [Montipora foliosa]|uniref:rRNA N6-adenosine-methyltransferase ZCCHC4-like isoform X2 n=1 Tax=Montipora foliosa TaxID=591990 RepID=UPI0035F102F4